MKSSQSPVSSPGRAPTVGPATVNGLNELHRRAARGFCYRDNYRLRMLMIVAGPKPAVGSLVQGLEQAQPGTFTVTNLADDAAAGAAVTDRKVYGALSLSTTGATLYTAAAASPAVAQELTQSTPAALKQTLPQAAITVTELVPNPADDPHGAALPKALIPITLTSIAGGAVIAFLGGTRRLRLGALAMYAVLAGALSTLAIQTLVGGPAGSRLSNAAVINLATLAIASATTGPVAVAGPAGPVVNEVFVFFVGFPFSSATTAWQLVPTHWGQLARYLPIGATNTALRSVAFFSGAIGVYDDQSNRLDPSQ